jgi:hypothetical protein
MALSNADRFGRWTRCLPRVAFDDEANYYSQAIADGPVARLQERIEQGQVNLKYDPACGYMIYSEAFDNLPREMKLALYSRLWKILSGEDLDPAFQKIPEETKRAIRDILIETKPDIPRYWTL